MMSKYITKGSFKAGKPGAVKTLKPGSEVSAKDLGISENDAKRYVELGLLVEKPAEKPADKAAKE